MTFKRLVVLVGAYFDSLVGGRSLSLIGHFPLATATATEPLPPPRVVCVPVSRSDTIENR